MDLWTMQESALTTTPQAPHHSRFYIAFLIKEVNFSDHWSLSSFVHRLRVALSASLSALRSTTGRGVFNVVSLIPAILAL
jgi:hypothetical protein